MIKESNSDENTAFDEKGQNRGVGELYPQRSGLTQASPIYDFLPRLSLTIDL